MDYDAEQRAAEYRQRRDRLLEIGTNTEITRPIDFPHHGGCTAMQKHVAIESCLLFVDAVIRKHAAQSPPSYGHRMDIEFDRSDSVEYYRMQNAFANHYDDLRFILKEKGWKLIRCAMIDPRDFVYTVKCAGCRN